MTLQIIIVLALIFASYFVGYNLGKKIQTRMTDLYRDMWLRQVNPDDPKYAPIKEYYGKRSHD